MAVSQFHVEGNTQHTLVVMDVASLNHRKNVLSCVNRSYHLPFRGHRNTWKTTIVPQCLANSSKYTSIWNSSIRKTSLIFYNSSSRITIAKPHTKCMSQYSTWENTKGILATRYTKHSLRNHSLYLEGYAGICIAGVRQQNYYDVTACR